MSTLAPAALQKATELSWQSSTRLVIHFGDSPCHGNQYHNGFPVNGPDTFPAGDPRGRHRSAPHALLYRFWPASRGGPVFLQPVLPTVMCSPVALSKHLSASRLLTKTFYCRRLCCCAGLVPEELLLQLYSMRVDYHFARIRADTDIMTGIFEEVGP